MIKEQTRQTKLYARRRANCTRLLASSGLVRFDWMRPASYLRLIILTLTNRKQLNRALADNAALVCKLMLQGLLTTMTARSGTKNNTPKFLATNFFKDFCPAMG